MQSATPVQRDAFKPAAWLPFVAEQRPTIIFSKDRDGRFVFVNDGLFRTHSSTEAMILGRNDAELFPRPVGATLAIASGSHGTTRTTTTPPARFSPEPHRRHRP